MFWSLDNSQYKVLLEDSVRFITKANVITKNDLVFVEITKNEILFDDKFGGKQKPISNTMKMSSNEYREFLASLSSSANKMQSYLNNKIFPAKFPYHPDELITNLQFSDKSMHLFFEIEDNMAGLMENDFCKK